MAELVNIHDEALEFEPIHRVLFGAEQKMLLEAFFKYFPSAGTGSGEKFEFISSFGSEELAFGKKGVAAGLLQEFLDSYIQEHGGSIDYIHGEDVVRSLIRNENALGFLLPAMDKSELFSSVIRDGPACRAKHFPWVKLMISGITLSQEGSDKDKVW